ncbi:hypothetical protein ACFMQL_05935 [Nonomuraea fastidiosa]|uniref:hypothetical protein n=1 Tax=Nonomuraea TaxID=83681 RepID=UPI0032473524
MEIARLVELPADDTAARRHPHTAAALVGLATGKGLVAVTALLAGPAALAAAPGLTARLAHHCHALLAL